METFYEIRFKKNNINKKDLYELSFNLKMLCFIKPDNVIKIYKKIL